MEANSSRNYARAKTGTRTGMYDLVEEERRKRRKLPITGIISVMLLCIGLLWILKAYLIADMGDVAHQERLAELQAQDDTFGQVGAFLVQKDPLTIKMIEILFPAAAANAPQAPKTVTVTEEEKAEEPKPE
ncbi:MAG: hypothetical protein AAF429_13700 [Pseudomonadota bacterium]